MNETNRRVAIITGGSQGIGAGLSTGTAGGAGRWWHGDLVAQDEDLGVLGTVGAGEQGEPAEHAEHRQIGEP